MVSRNDIKVLVVDHSHIYLRITASILEKIGLNHVELVSDTNKALNMLAKRQDFNIIISDVLVPNMPRGLDFIRQVRSIYTPQELPILVISASSEEEHVSATIRAGADAYVIKPPSADVFELHFWRLINLTPRKEILLGEFLVQQAVITNEERNIALKYQQLYSVDHTSLAAVALYMGILTETQLIDTLQNVDFVLDDELLFAKMEELGVDREKVEGLRKVKRKFRYRIGDVLVKFGYIQRDELEHSFRQFETYQKQRRLGNLPPLEDS